METRVMGPSAVSRQKRASLVAQLVENPPAMWETWVWSLGQEYPLEKEKVTHSNILAWRSPWGVHGVAKSRIWLSTFHFQCKIKETRWVWVWLIHVDVWQKPTQFVKQLSFNLKKLIKKKWNYVALKEIRGNQNLGHWACLGRGGGSWHCWGTGDMATGKI